MREPAGERRRPPARAAAAGALLLAAASPARSWYVPGVSPVSYVRGQPVRIMANSMTSNTGLFPYGAYTVKTCAPSKERRRKEAKTENLGEILWGDQIEPSLYRAEMLVNVSCRRLCDTMLLDMNEMKKLERRIEQNYRGNLVLDNLPVTQENRVSAAYPPVVIGYPLGVPRKLAPDKKTALINNHLDLTIVYHRPEIQPSDGQEAWRIVGFHAAPRSVAHPNMGEDCHDGKQWSAESLQPLRVTEPPLEVTWTYSVTWREDPNTPWATRWDSILRSAENDAKIHWFSIVNSALIVLFLSGMVAMILLRSLHKDFNRYNDPENEDAAQEETGWKLCHGDVFRPPARASMLAILIGTGCQLLGMALTTLIFALLGFLSPANRGGLLTAMLLLFVLLGGYAGYVTAALCKALCSQSWRNVFGVGLFFPGSMMAVYFVLNIVQWRKGSSSAIPATSLLALFGMWFGISLPLVIVGGVVGFKRPAIEFPCRYNPIPRAIPPQNWYIQAPFVVPVAGVLPFGAVFIELVFILSSLWLGRVYYVFGFLSLVFVIAVITCAEISIVVVYFQLCYEDYNWWWRSFFCSASSGVHLMLYAVFYFFHTLNITQFSSCVMYFGYMSMVAFFFALCTGTIGFLASLVFTRRIYAGIKVD
eukprot:TRINITY_DN65146_c0_g1_i1.p1 TRINITY_DN65146_c0_g1~~TRINITY_DN65146_c0_g1_i1.p1  ORF type:complete len:647 (+),score=236.47 TRINITY_DN65146_c0_g1_i1:120-2060(+)